MAKELGGRIAIEKQGSLPMGGGRQSLASVAHDGDNKTGRGFRVACKSRAISVQRTNSNLKNKQVGK